MKLCTKKKKKTMSFKVIINVLVFAVFQVTNKYYHRGTEREEGPYKGKGKILWKNELVDDALMGMKLIRSGWYIREYNNSYFLKYFLFLKVIFDINTLK
jgi:hypothetical protein